MANSVWVIIETNSYDEERLLGVCSSKVIADLTIEALMRETSVEELRAEEFVIDGVSRKVITDIERTVNDARTTIMTYEKLLTEMKVSL